MKRKLVKKIDGLNIVIPNSVYDPAEDSFLLAENTAIKLNEKVLEIGSGSGYVSIYLAKKNPSAEFFSIDLNYIASKTTLINSINNSVKLNITT
ncbi:MAG: methyltransferase, partial [Asgard group archaeon]|nr:methyltransferase [Asgard group archaeon]